MPTSFDPSSIFGVDFSAAANDAGRNTWIAKCKVESSVGEANSLVVERLADAATFLQCSPGRDSTLTALGKLIREEVPDQRAFGLDFPFGLPRELLGCDWDEFISGVRERNEWGELGEIDEPRALYDVAKNRAKSEDISLHRETDTNRGGQEPTGFRIKSQTYHGISELLAKIPTEISVLPMDDLSGNTVVLETYPAATFRRLSIELDIDVHDTGYKRDTREAICRRRRNIDALTEAGVEFNGQDAFAVASDDALDAVAAAWATWKASESGYETLDEGATGDPSKSMARSEGYIFY